MLIAFWHHSSGASLSLLLHPLMGGAAVNGPTGSELVEPDAVAAPGYYESEVDVELDGRYVARVHRDGALIYQGLLTARPGTTHFVVGADGTGNVTHLLGAPLQESSPGRLAGNVSFALNNADQETNLTLDAIGSSGATLQTLVDVGQFDASASAGHTRFLLFDVDSGPGGSGRALYLDNA